MEQLMNYGRLSLNQITTEKLALPEAVDACARAGVPWIALWRHKVAETGLAASAKLVKDAGLKVSSLCRGGMFQVPMEGNVGGRLDDNRRAVEEAAELGADVLVLVCGPALDKDIGGGRQRIAEGIAELVPFAEACGVKLGIEPLHPMYAAERSAINLLSQANDIAECYRPDQVGVIVDVFHVWWDPDLYRQIARAEGRIIGYHVSDWIVPTPDLLMGRGMMGDGVIELRRIRQAVEAAGYKGPIEVEIFNKAIWELAGDEAIALMKRRYLEHV